MQEARAVISDRIQAATAKRIRQYEQLKGKKVGEFPFWDIVVIGSGDKAQKVAYELQLEEKLAQDKLPLGVDYCVVADPGTEKIGGGGSLMAILQCLKETYQEELQTKKVLVIPAGGYSQRLPNASLLGKMFLSMPLGNPLYQMFDLKLALSIDIPSKMSAGIFLVTSDCIELYDDEDSATWSFCLPGVTALGHPSHVSIGTGHGVFVVPPRHANNSSVEVVTALEFLHKPSIDTMRTKEAILNKDFCYDIGAEGEMVLTDSNYYMDFNTALKLLELYNDESPLRCEIDCHGDFMQPLGPCATSEYIKNTSNVGIVTQSLTRMRQKIFDVLKGTPLNVVVMQHSHFYHIGTTNEYLDHVCNLTPFAKEMGLDVYKPSNADGNSEAKLPGKVSGKGSASACVMNSICPKSFTIEDRCIVEHCEFKTSMIIHGNSIISSCSVGPTPDGNPVTIPKNTFLYTACVSDGRSKKRYATIAFGIQDDLKKVVPASSLGELSIFDKSFKAIFGTALDQAGGFLIPKGTTLSLWHTKLFQPAATMEESFSSTMTLVETLLHNSPWQPSPCEWEGRVSMADLIKTKDIFGMLAFRWKLTEQVHSNANNCRKI